MKNPLFPLPEPSFLFVHTVTRYRTSETRQEPDAEGWAKPVDVDATQHEDVRCYVAQPDYRDVGVGQVVSGVVLMSRDFVVSYGDSIEIPAQAGVHSSQVGWHDVTEVRSNPSHTRVLTIRNDRGGQVTP